MYDLIKVMAAALLMPLPFLFLLVALGLVWIALGWRRLGLSVSSRPFIFVIPAKSGISQGLALCVRFR